MGPMYSIIEIVSSHKREKLVIYYQKGALLRNSILNKKYENTEFKKKKDSELVRKFIIFI